MPVLYTIALRSYRTVILMLASSTVCSVFTKLTGFFSMTSTNLTPPTSRLCRETFDSIYLTTSSAVMLAPADRTTYARGASSPSLYFRQQQR